MSSANKEYDNKILLAWGEAISGNSKIREWLIKNDYQELGLFVHALYNQDDARDWLMKNGHSHLMALVNGAEGNTDAVKWLNKNGFTIMAKVALAADGNSEAFKWLRENDLLFATIAKKIKEVKDKIEEDNWDAHKLN